LGLKSIKKRVENLKGTVSFDNDANGFMTSIVLPI
jgi:signal transduction histidine kinase